MHLNTPTDLAWALAQPSGLLINMYSDNGVHVVHQLPLEQGCRGDLMSITPANPKIYVANLQELQNLNLSNWKYCQYC